LEQRKRVKPFYDLLENGEVFSSRLFLYARTLVRLADESAKPDAERLGGYNAARIPDWKRWLFADLPINEPLEIRKLTDSLASFEDELGSKNELVIKVLAGKRPAERAQELVRGSRLGNVAARRYLADCGSRAIQQLNDPMIDLARIVDAPGRDVRAQLLDNIGEQIRREKLRIAIATQAVAGPDAYPDATGTLRLSFGTVTKLDEQMENDPVFWTLTSLFWRLQDRPLVAPPKMHSALEPRSLRVQRPLKFDTPFSFESDADGTFGNSGSPVLNRRGEQIGVVSRGPYEAMRLTYEYDAKRSRFSGVHMAGIFEILLNVYGAIELVRELTGPEEDGRAVARSK